MKNFNITNDKCNKCGGNEKLTEHHLFGYYQVKKEMLMILGRPDKFEEHPIFHKSVMQMFKKIPRIILCENCHREIEKRKEPIKLRHIWT